MSQNNIKSLCDVCGEKSGTNTSVCIYCTAFTLSRPCTVCLYAHNLDEYALDQWNNPKRVCKGCMKDGKQPRDLVGTINI